MRYVFLATGCAALLLPVNAAVCREPAKQASPRVASAWPPADALFHRDPRWLGGDSAASVDLGQGRVLWLFGDSFVAASATSEAPIRRSQAVMVRNSVAIQSGYDPTVAEFETYWKMEANRPVAFFKSPREAWIWPGSGCLINGQLLLFLMEFERREGQAAFGFRPRGYLAMLVTNPRDPPEAWRSRRARVPERQMEVLLGSGGVLAREGFVYAMGALAANPHPHYVARWPVADAQAGDLRCPAWWDAMQNRWVPQREMAELPPPLLPRGQTEFSVHEGDAAARFLHVQINFFPFGRIVARRSESLVGPWTEPAVLFDPVAEIADREGLLVYAAKAHPEQDAGGLAITYCTNAMQLGRVRNDESLYYPRFCRLVDDP